MDDIPSIASYVLERPVFGAFTLSLVGLIAVGWYAVQRHDESKPIRTPTRILLVGFALGTVVLAGVAFWAPRVAVDKPIATVAPSVSAPPEQASSIEPEKKLEAFAEAPPERTSRPTARPATDTRVGPNVWGLKCFNRPLTSITDEQGEIYERCKAESDPRILDDLFYNTEPDARAAASLLNACMVRSSPTFRCEPEYRP